MQDHPDFWHQVQIWGGSQTTLGLDNPLEGLTELIERLYSKLWHEDLNQ